MSNALPEPVAAYFAAEKAADADALARCFIEDGVVRDEGGTFEGVAAIKQWNTAARESITTRLNRSMSSSEMARLW